MPEEFEGDLAGAVFWGADLSGARFRDVDLTGVTISHAWLVDVDIDALVESVVINGVDVTDYVNERDPWYPLRAMLRPADPAGMRAAWAALEAEWATTIAQARALPESAVHESVDGEWSFVQTLRHLVFAMDKWFTAPILGGPFHPIGLPNSGSVDFPWPGLDGELHTVARRRSRRAGGSSDALPRLPRIAVGERSRHDRSTCSRTAPTRCASASTPCSRRRSGTTATRGGTSTGWGRIRRRRKRDEAVLRRRGVRRPTAAQRRQSATPGWPTSASACTSRRRSHQATATAGTPRGRASPTGWCSRPTRALAAGHTVSATGLLPPSGRVLPPGVLLASRRPRRHAS